MTMGGQPESEDAEADEAKQRGPVEAKHLTQSGQTWPGAQVHADEKEQRQTEKSVDEHEIVAVPNELKLSDRGWPRKTKPTEKT